MFHQVLVLKMASFRTLLLIILFIVYSWKLSRSKQLATTNSTAITEAIANVDVLDNIYYEPIDQSDETCFYLPDLAPGEPVVIPGQCDQNISVVQNFDAASVSVLK